jgi:hypothetical protein
MALKKNNLFYLLLCLFVFSTCSGLSTGQSASFANVTGTSFFYSYPSDGRLVFIGVAEKRSNPNETLQLALEDAARRVAVFYNVSGEYAIKNNTGSGAFDYSQNTSTRLFTDQEQSKQYVDTLQYNAGRDSIEIDNSFFIFIVYQSSMPNPVNYYPKYSGADRKPDWIDNPPNKIDGYEIGVGFSGRYSSITDTFTNSWYNAVFAIIRNVNMSSQSSDLFYQNTGGLFGYKTSNDNMLYSFGALNYFYVLDTWIDTKTKSVWTLAIAKKSN